MAVLVTYDEDEVVVRRFDDRDDAIAAGKEWQEENGDNPCWGVPEGDPTIVVKG